MPNFLRKMRENFIFLWNHGKFSIKIVKELKILPKCSKFFIAFLKDFENFVYARELRPWTPHMATPLPRYAMVELDPPKKFLRALMHWNISNAFDPIDINNTFWNFYVLYNIIFTCRRCSVQSPNAIKSLTLVILRGSQY